MSLFALISGVWLLLLLRRWSSRVSAVEKAIARYPWDRLPHLPESGEPDLDRIVAAINHLSLRLTAAQEQSTALTRQLAQADRLAVLGRMAADLSHEIRNPIATIRLHAENAREKPPERQHLALDAVLQQVQRLDHLMQRVMAIVQPLNLDPGPVALRPWLQDCVSQFEDQAHRLGIMLRTDGPDIEVVFDAPNIGRALQYTTAGGEIDITVQTSDGTLLFCVEDSGPGVSEPVRGQVFEPLITTRADGVGLGLAIVREIAEAHGGEVRCTPGRQGARFEVELPWHISWSPTMITRSARC